MFRFVLTLFAVWVVLSQQAIAARHALLIGCSDYKTHSDLHGGGIDVELFRQKLATPRFGFEPADFTVLSDADLTTKPPTYDNICAAFETVVAAKWAVDLDSDVLLIYMSGHGGQRKSESENDGTDEFFMPIDETNVILDDQVVGWLGELNRKAIHVWIVFDSCFSGTMSRGGHPDETVRGLVSSELDAMKHGTFNSNADVSWELPLLDQMHGPTVLRSTHVKPLSVRSKIERSKSLAGKQYLMVYLRFACCSAWTSCA